MSLLQIATYAGTVIALCSVVLNIVQFIRRRNDRKTLRSQLWAAYNTYYGIAECCDRARKMKGTHGADAVWEMIERVTGYVDGGRGSIISTAREHVGLDLKREHLAKPIQRGGKSP